jgi:uncharacterized protein (TIGR02284 family)
MTTSNPELRQEKVDTLNELIQATRDSAQFYADAAQSVTNPALRSLFTDMADSKQGLVGSMAKEVRAEAAQPAVTGTLRGSLHQLYSTLRASMAKDHGDFAYVRELEKSEDRLLAAFHDVIKRDDAPRAVKESLLSYLPKVQAHHDAMRDRKQVGHAGPPLNRAAPRSQPSTGSTGRRHCIGRNHENHPKKSNQQQDAVGHDAGGPARAGPGPGRRPRQDGRQEQRHAGQGRR